MSDVNVGFAAKDEGFSSSLKKFNSNLEDVGKSAQKASAVIGASFASMIKAGAGLALGVGAVKAVFAGITGTIGSFTDALDMGGRLADTASRTGLLAGEVLLLERAFSNTGLSADDVAGTINKMQKALVGVNEEGEPTNKTFAQLGLNMSYLKTLSPDQQFKQIAQAISDIPDPAERAAAAMGIFGKSGAAMLPLFRDFSATMSDAKGQLGSMVDVMNKNASTFDAVGDKIKVIQGKFKEFAAGVLDVVIPALDFVTEGLARIDAAKLGKDLATAFVGATIAMDGFAAATNLVKAGDFSGAFSLAFSSIVLQVKQTANEIYRNFIAAFSAAGSFLATVFDVKGAIAQTAFALFEIMGQKLVSVISRGLSNAFDGNALTQGLSDGLRNAAITADLTAKGIQTSLTGAGGRIADQFKAAGTAFPTSFAEAYAQTEPLFTGLEADAAALEATMARIPVPAEKLSSVWTDILSNVDNASMSLTTKFNAGIDSAVGASEKLAANFAGISGGLDSGLGDGKSPLSDQVAALKTSVEQPSTGMSAGPAAAAPSLPPGFRALNKAGTSFEYQDSRGNTRSRIDARAPQSSFNTGGLGKKIDVFGGKTAEEFAGKVGGKESPAMKMARERTEREAKEGKQTEKKKDAAGGAKAGDAGKKEDPLTTAVEKIRSLMESLEKKLPVNALAA
ncbi:hypothetical protein [Propionivibrio sp.]|uniref:hypothetical protein n=1 Tax=Propionivibrio sp. TaxID=2212460 RepID=UPI003BF13C28